MADTPQFDCIVSGSCTIDLIVRPVDLDKPIGHSLLYAVEPFQVIGGGITSNTGITMARLGMKTGILSFVGDDAWGRIIRDLYRSEGVDESILMTHPTRATSTTVVLIDDRTAERSFLHCIGAPRELTAKDFLDHLDLFARSRFWLLGYYSLLPNAEADLPEVFRRVRETGCRTAMDSAGDGGKLQPLDKMLPHLDVWVPSLQEAINQTGEQDPRKIVEVYRDCGAPGIVGVKLGKRGVLLSPKPGDFLQIPSVEPPGKIVDTTGAGDSFLGGLITGLIKGLSPADAGRLGAAAAACCITSVGGCTGGRDYAFTAKLAGLS